jgi:hypothetical protein
MKSLQHEVTFQVTTSRRIKLPALSCPTKVSLSQHRHTCVVGDPLHELFELGRQQKLRGRGQGVVDVWLHAQVADVRWKPSVQHWLHACLEGATQDPLSNFTSLLPLHIVSAYNPKSETWGMCTVRGPWDLLATRRLSFKIARWGDRQTEEVVEEFKKGLTLSPSLHINTVRIGKLDS